MPSSFIQSLPPILPLIKPIHRKVKQHSLLHPLRERSVQRRRDRDEYRCRGEVSFVFGPRGGVFYVIISGMWQRGRGRELEHEEELLRCWFLGCWHARGEHEKSIAVGDIYERLL